MDVNPRCNMFPAILPAEGAIVTEQQIIEGLYARAGMNDSLRKFAFGEPRSDSDPTITSEDDVLAAFADYSQLLGPFIMDGNEVNVPLVRAAFDRVFVGLNAVGSEKLGYKRPSGILGAVLEKAGVRNPQPNQYFRPMNDRYWDVQFPAEHEGQVLIRRADDESIGDYTTRYVQACLRAYVFPHFSFLQQATRSL
jgi:hypothetical protein